MASVVEYDETMLGLNPEGQVTLFADCVLEDLNATTRDFFGFDRTAAISNLSTGTIVEAAHHFGQEGDITLLRLMAEEADHA